ncbi:DUF2332 family protein [Arsenicicoccus dermatophilus]|uniref:DUF2332 family protein n=1 Tax=Arsenicicoccus dermatophilus TaxID=1076331 RepID=UPI0039174C1D
MTTAPIADRYRAFAVREAAGSSATLHDWALAVADDDQLLGLIGELPTGKQQPNLVLAAARLHGATPGDADSLRHTLVDGWPAVRATVLARSTQTNEAARCAAILLGLQRIHRPIALLEVGASAGLCLVPDHYSYAFSDGSRLDPGDGPGDLTIPIALGPGLRPPARMPQVVWRAGLDLNPLDPGDQADLAWLQTLVWPEHDERRERLTRAAALATRVGVQVRRGDLLVDLPALAAEAPPAATLVVVHTAVLAYLTEKQRAAAVELVTRARARRLSFVARGVDPTVPPIGAPLTPDTHFVAALDGTAYALGNGHGDRLTPVHP